MNAIKLEDGDYQKFSKSALLWMWNAYGMDYGDVFKPFRNGKLPQDDLAETLKNGASYEVLCAEERAKSKQQNP